MSIALLWHTDTASVVWIDPAEGTPEAFAAPEDAIRFLHARGFHHETTFRVAENQTHAAHAERWTR